VARPKSSTQSEKHKGVVRRIVAASPEVAELRAEIARLREALEMEPTSEEAWGASAPQELRDRMAATALVAEKLDEWNALRRLGFDIPAKPRDGTNPIFRTVKGLGLRIFGTPGVQAILDLSMQDAEANKAAIIARLIETAKHGTDGESTRATQQLAKMADWNEGDKKVAAAGANKLNLMQMFGSPSQNGSARVVQDTDHDAIIDAEEFLVHEPSAEGERVIDEDAVALPQ
jgi:hypothetical protein